MSRLTIPVDSSDHVQGPTDAPVTLVEYGDYECPFCGEAYYVLKDVQQTMGDRLLFVFRNFPISESHPHAVHAAEFAEEAGRQGVFWPAHDMLYENQDALGDDNLRDYGQRLGLDVSALRESFRGRFTEKIRRDFLGGVRSGVNGTPTLFINGRRYDGPLDAESIVRTLEEAAHLGAT
jgi:protein-disulfide isomerase